MATPQENEPNPYQAPIIDDRGLSAAPPDPNMVKKFRQQIHALGAFWIFIGGFAVVVVVLMFAGQRDLLQLGEAGVVAAMVGVLAAAWISLGILTCLKQIWAVYIGLALSYLSLIGNLLSINLCATVIVVMVILQAHRVISWANRMRAQNIPLTTKV